MVVLFEPAKFAHSVFQIIAFDNELRFFVLDEIWHLGQTLLENMVFQLVSVFAEFGQSHF
jgi:hypothetical protein